RCRLSIPTSISTATCSLACRSKTPCGCARWPPSRATATRTAPSPSGSIPRPARCRASAPRWTATPFSARRRTGSPSSTPAAIRGAFTSSPPRAAARLRSSRAGQQARARDAVEDELDCQRREQNAHDPGHHRKPGEPQDALDGNRDQKREPGDQESGEQCGKDDEEVELAVRSGGQENHRADGARPGQKRHGEGKDRNVVARPAFGGLLVGGAGAAGVAGEDHVQGDEEEEDAAGGA